MPKTNEKYGLFTAIAMIVGICIGSGIFFKSDNILIATGGSVFLGVLVFALASMSVVFGGLCMSRLALRTDKAGGAISYFEEFGSERLACCFGWFQVFIYYPAICAVIAWVVGIYTCILFNLPSTLGLQTLIGFLFCTLCFFYNTLSAKLGGAFQNAATVIKLIPLFVIGILGVIFGNPAEGFANITSSSFSGASWITAVGPVAFAYDGWIVSTSISHEIRNSKRNMALALTTAPIFVLLSYILYFVGISSYIGPQTVMDLGDAHVYHAAEKLFGSFGAKAIVIFVTISVMGTLNGLILGYIRVPYSLAQRGRVIPLSGHLRVENKKLAMPVRSAVFAYIITALWMAVNFAVMNFNLLPNSDISEVPIAVSYFLYMILYFYVFIMYRKGEIKELYFGVIVPLLATLGALFIITGSLKSIYFTFYAAFCILLTFSSFAYYNSNENKPDLKSE